MAIKIYKEGASAVVDDGTEVIISSFSYEEENEIITILDQESFNNVWNDYWYRLQKKDGSSCGATLSDVLDYLATVTSGEGGGTSKPLANFSMPGTITNFYSFVRSLNSTGNLYASQTYYTSFRLESTTKIQNVGLKISSLSSTSGAKMYVSLYKYDIDTDNLNLVAVMPSEIDIDSATGVTGWNFINLGSSVTLEPGIYFTRIKLSANFGLNFPGSTYMNETFGWEGTGTSNNPIYAFYELGIAYDFGSTPTSITFSSLSKGTNSSYAPPKGIFYRLTN